MQGHVLIVENDEPTRQGLCGLFQKVGVAVRSTGSIKGALTELASNPVLVVLDLALQDGNGIEVLKAIRGTESRAKVATVSATADAPFPEWICDLHPDALFGKPFDFEDFARWLSAAPSRDLMEMQGE